MKKFRDYLIEAKMTDEECLSACKQLAKSGDDKAKEFANGLIAYYEKEKSFHPNQIAGLQNIMKNASFQMAEQINEAKVTSADGEYMAEMFQTLYGLTNKDLDQAMDWIDIINTDAKLGNKIDYRKDQKALYDIVKRWDRAASDVKDYIKENGIQKI